MLRAAIIAPEQQIIEELAEMLKKSNATEFLRALQGYPSDKDLDRFMRSAFPMLIFVSMGEPLKAEYIARWVHRFAPGTQIIGVSTKCDTEVMRTALRAGLRDCLPFPLAQEQLTDALRSAEESLTAQPQQLPNRGKVISFLPAKPGVGASTIAVNAALALTKHTPDRVLLADFDLNLGLHGFMLKLEKVHSAQEAGENAYRMDEDLWEDLIVSKGRLDILGSGYITPGQRLETGAIRDLMGFWRRNYSAVCLDHSGNLERYSVELLMESDEILLVSTSEIAPLHLARTKMTILRGYGLADRISLVINRTSRRDTVTKEDIEKLVGLPVSTQIPNDYARVEAALRKGAGVDPSSSLGQRYEALAKQLLGKDVKAARPQGKKKFIEYFALENLFSSTQRAIEGR